MPNDNYANEPNQSRSEDIIQSILDNTEYNEDARSRIEYLLIELKNAIEGGGGGGGVTSYAPLTEKPKIDNCTLQAGNNTSSDLGLQTKLTFDSTPTESSTNPVISGGVYTALTGKADKSTTYTKTEVDEALSSKQNTISDLATIRSGAAAGATAVQPVSGKGLSTNDYTNGEKTKLAGIAEGAEVNVQSNWEQTTTTADDYIKNKPTLGTAAALDVAASGNASTSQIVKGNDTRLTDARNAADVSSWAKAANKPSYNGSEIALTGYTEAQSKSNVAATDTTNAAIGKLEYRVETNENNISYNTNNGVKNIWNVTIPSNLPSGFTMTRDSDGGFVFNGNTGNSGFSCTTQVWFGTEAYVLSGCPSGGSDDSYRIDILRGDNSVICYGDPVEAGGFVQTKSYACRIRIAANYTCNNLKFYPMICLKSLYDADPSYQPYAMSNAELTAKEQVNENNISTDEEALVELVDGGAKNIADFTLTTKTTYTTDTSHGVTITRNGDIFTVSGTSDTDNNNFFNIYYAGSPSAKIIPPGNWVALIEDYTGSIVKDIAVQACTPAMSPKVYGIPVQFSISGSESGNWIRVNLRPSTTYDGSFRLMICTKAAWDISHAYQPYRPSEDEQNAQIETNKNNISTINTDTTLLKNTITTIRFSQGVTRTITFPRSNYNMFVVFGFVQGVGLVHWDCRSSNDGVLSVHDVLTGNNVTQSTITYTRDLGASTATATISSDVAQWSYLTIIKNADIT